MARLILFPKKYPTTPERLYDGTSRPGEFSTWSPPAEYKSTDSKAPCPLKKPSETDPTLK